MLQHKIHTNVGRQCEKQVQSALMLDIVVGEGAAVLQLLALVDEALLVGGDAVEVSYQ